MAPNAWILVGRAFEKARDKGVDVNVERLAVDWDEVRKARDGVRSHLGGRMLSEHKELGDHEVERSLAADLHVHLARVIFAGFLEDVESGLLGVIHGKVSRLIVKDASCHKYLLHI